jgi:hypothetical protein
MTASTPATDTDAIAKPFSMDEINQILALSRNAKSIEIKLSIPASGHRATIKSIGLDPVEAQPRQVFFFDTPDMALNRAGLIVRARRIQGGTADTVVKLRPVDPATVDAELKHSESFKVELDIMPGGFVCSASYKGVATGEEVLEVTTGEKPLHSLFSKGQRAFFAQHAPAGIDMDSLRVLGPTFLLKARHKAEDFRFPLTIEMWLYPDGSRILEVSTKCEPSEALQVGLEFKAYLASKGIAITESQQTKTKTAMDFFKAELDDAESR